MADQDDTNELLARHQIAARGHGLHLAFVERTSSPSAQKAC
jgi:hypothetical protein